MFPGIMLGILGPFFGFLIYHQFMFPHKPLEVFWNMILQSPTVQSPILSLTLIFNLLLFFGSVKVNMYYMARGILLGTFLYVPFAIYLKYF